MDIDGREERLPLSEVYRRPAPELPRTVAGPEAGALFFGRQVFPDWAMRFQSGIFDEIPSGPVGYARGGRVPAGACTQRSAYFVYFRINGCAEGFLRRARELNGNPASIGRLLLLCKKRSGGVVTRIGVENGFHFPPRVLKRRRSRIGGSRSAAGVWKPAVCGAPYPAYRPVRSGSAERHFPRAGFVGPGNRGDSGGSMER